jgi:phage internal scaffolding protein
MKKSMPFLRTPYNYDVDFASDESALTCEDTSLTQQHQKEDADINHIVARFGLTGELPFANRQPRYGDFTAVTDYHSAMNAVRSASEDFMSLPAELRARFNNDPAALIDFLASTDNRDEAIKLGLVNAPIADSVSASATTDNGGGSTVTT